MLMSGEIPRAPVEFLIGVGRAPAAIRLFDFVFLSGTEHMAWHSACPQSCPTHSHISQLLIANRQVMYGMVV